MFLLSPISRSISNRVLFGAESNFDFAIYYIVDFNSLSFSTSTLCLEFHTEPSFDERRGVMADSVVEFCVRCSTSLWRKSLFISFLISDFAVSFDLEFAVEFASRPDVKFLSVFNVRGRRRCSFSLVLRSNLFSAFSMFCFGSRFR